MEGKGKGKRKSEEKLRWKVYFWEMENQKGRRKEAKIEGDFLLFFFFYQILLL